MSAFVGRVNKTVSTASTKRCTVKNKKLLGINNALKLFSRACGFINKEFQSITLYNYKWNYLFCFERASRLIK